MLKNLASRDSDSGQISVSLDWNSQTEEILVRVVSPTEDFTLYPPRNLALDCFNHPYAYAARALSSGRMDKCLS